MSDDRLVFDDQHLAGQLAVDGLLGAQDGGFDLVRGLIQDEGGFLQAEGLDGGQQQGGPLVGRKGLQAGFRALAGTHTLAFVVVVIMLRPRFPDGVEDAVQPHPGRHPLDKALIPRQKRGQGGAHMGVPAALGPGQGPGIAAQIRQVRRKGLRHAHGLAPSAQNKSSDKELTSTEKVPYPAGTIILDTRWNHGKGTGNGRVSSDNQPATPGFRVSAATRKWLS